MTHEISDHRERHSTLDQPGGQFTPEIVEPHVRYPCPLSGVFPGRAEALPLDTLCPREDLRHVWLPIALFVKQEPLQSSSEP